MRGPVSAAVAALLLTAAPAAGGGEVGRAPGPSGSPPPASAQPTGPRPGGPVDAGLLADLDLLDSADYRRDHEVARRQGLLDPLRLLEAERARAGGSDAPAGSTGGAGSTGKDRR